MTRDVIRQLDSLFPSSKPYYMLYEVKEGKLPTSELFSYMIASSFYFADGNKLVRICSITFSVGLRSEDLCRYGISVCFDDGLEAGIKTITESDTRIAAGRLLGRKSTRFRQDGDQGESWKFDSKLERFGNFLALAVGKPTEISSSHPLLDPVKAKSARIVGEGGNGEMER
jgi:hypothetical protein